jgi:type II secretory pathway component GspD/PulD (secretin)
MRRVPIYFLKRVSVLFLLLVMQCTSTIADESDNPLLSMTMRDADISEVMEMLSRQNRVNILLGENTDASVSFNLYDVRLDQAISSIANAAGYTVEKRRDTYFILPPADAGKMPGTGFKVVRTFPIQYADAAVLETKLEDYVSEYGSITAVPERKLLVVEDQPAFVRQMAALVAALDRRPQQVMIEARILEVTLNDEQSYGIDWTSFFDNKEGSFGLQGLSTPGSAGGTGLFFDYVQADFEVAIRALEAEGRIRNLASPKLVTVENEEAEVIIGQRLGYQVTTTINQVTSETIEFLESGVILRVVPAVDDDGRILLTIHPEVSNGVLDDNGIPSQTTTEVTTQLLVSSGQSIFIGGLLRHTTTEGRAGVPVLGRIPGIRWLFGNRTRQSSNTETVVLITPRLLDAEFQAFSDQKVNEVDEAEAELSVESQVIEEHIEKFFGVPETPSTAPVTEASPDEDLRLTTEVTDGNNAPSAAIESAETARPSKASNVDDDRLEPASTEAENKSGADVTTAETVAKSPSSSADDGKLSSDASQAVKQARAGIELVDLESLPERRASTQADTTSVARIERPAVNESSSAGDMRQETPPVEQNPETAPVRPAAIDSNAALGLYAINLESAIEPIDPGSIDPSLAAPHQQLYVTEVDVDGRTWYRLRLGFFATQTDGDRVLAEFSEQYPFAWVVRIAPREHAIAKENAVFPQDQLTAEAIE